MEEPILFIVAYDWGKCDIPEEGEKESAVRNESAGKQTISRLRTEW